MKPEDSAAVCAPKLGCKKANAGRRGAGWAITTQDPSLSPVVYSVNTFNLVWDSVVQSSALGMQNLDPSATVPPQMLAATPSKNLIVKSGLLHLAAL